MRWTRHTGLAGDDYECPGAPPGPGGGDWNGDTMGLLIHLLILPFRRPIVAIVLGLAIVGGVLAYDWDQAPTCGGETMDSGSVCRRVTDSEGTYDKTYDDMREQQSTAPYIWGSLGGLLVLGGAVSWPIRRRRAAREAATVAQG